MLDCLVYLQESQAQVRARYGANLPNAARWHSATVWNCEHNQPSCSVLRDKGGKASDLLSRSPCLGDGPIPRRELIFQPRSYRTQGAAWVCSKTCISTLRDAKRMMFTYGRSRPDASGRAVNSPHARGRRDVNKEGHASMMPARALSVQRSRVWFHVLHAFV